MSRRLDILLERARRVLDETVNDYASEELFVFDFDKTLQHKYKPLPVSYTHLTLPTSHCV